MAYNTGTYRQVKGEGRNAEAKIRTQTRREIFVSLIGLSYHTQVMRETSIQTPVGFNDLSKAEQVRYLQALWDQISQQPEEIPVPESHLQLLEERLRQHRENPSATRPAFDVIDRLSKKAE